MNRDFSDKENWYKKINPNIKNHHYYIKKILSCLAFITIITLLFMIYISIRSRNLLIGSISIVCLIWSFYSFLSLNPKLHNRLSIQKKIVPLKDDIDLITILNSVCKTNTPYGTPIAVIIKERKAPVPAYYIKGTGNIVYFYIENNEIIIDTKKFIPSKKFSKEKQKERKAFSFAQQLADLFCFYLNTGKSPNTTELERIFSE